MALLRRGECLRCGRCCHLSSLLSTDSNKWLAFGFDLGSVEKVPCKYLEFDRKGRAKCRIFGKPERPLACILYPTSPKDLLEECGYYFEDKLD